MENFMIKRDIEKEEVLKEAMKNHKCNGCIWGTNVGNKFVCSFPKCVKKKIIIK